MIDEDFWFDEDEDEGYEDECNHDETDGEGVCLECGKTVE